MTPADDLHDRLDDREGQLRLALAVAQLGVWEVDLADQTVRWDQGCGELYRLAPEEYPTTFEAYFPLVYADDRERLREAFYQAISGKSPFEAEFRVVRKDGSIRWHTTLGQVIADESGEPIRVVGVVQDVTVRRTA